MNEALNLALAAMYSEDCAWQRRNDAEAAKQKARGNEVAAIDLRLHRRLPDTCWALGRWQEARRWYRHNAALLAERRVWHAAHSGPDYPHDELSDWEVITSVKAGLLDEARVQLGRAIAYWQPQPDSAPTLVELGLHAAQIGDERWRGLLDALVDARADQLLDSGAGARREGRMLSYEPLQVGLLLSQWELITAQLQAGAGLRRAAQQGARMLFAEPLQQASLRAIAGIEELLKLQTGAVGGDVAQARLQFEAAAAHFFELNASPDPAVYFMRLNTLLADDIAAGRALDPNPFASNRWDSAEDAT